MNHPSENLSAYLDGELTDAEARAIEAQLAQDPSLMAELNDLKEAQDFMRSHGPIQAPPGFYTNVLSAVDEEPMQQSWWNWLSRPFGLPVQGLAVAGIAALVLILAIPFGAQQFVTNTGKGDLRSKTTDRFASSSSFGKDKGDVPVNGQAEPKGDDPDNAAGLGRFSTTPQEGDQINEPQEMLNVIPDRKESTKESGDKNTLVFDDLQVGQATDDDADSSGTISQGGMKPDAKEKAASKEKSRSKPLGSTGYVYTIQTDDPDALYNLFTLVKRYQGSLVDSTGRSITPAELKQGDSLNLQVFINEKSLNGLDRQLANIGSVKRSMPKSSELTSGGLHRLRIQLNRAGKASAPNSIQFEPNYPVKNKGKR